MAKPRPSTSSGAASISSGPDSRDAPPRPAGSRHDRTRYGGDAEQICGGFWPGHEGFPAAAFFAYGYPKPDGIEQASIGPEGAGWNTDIGEFVFPYDAMREAPDPGRALLDFLEGTYDACAQQMGWSPDLTRVQPTIVTRGYDVAAIRPIAPDW